MANMFFGCSSLLALPDLSLWSTERVTDFSGIFGECSSLIFLPDLSEWDLSEAKNISFMFFDCSSLRVLPDISIWDTSNVVNIESLFEGCSSLNIIPDISKWNANNIEVINNAFKNCNNLLIIPDISKWKNKLKQEIIIYETSIEENSEELSSILNEFSKVSSIKSNCNHELIENKKSKENNEKETEIQYNLFENFNGEDFENKEENNDYYDNFYSI